MNSLCFVYFMLTLYKRSYRSTIHIGTNFVSSTRESHLPIGNQLCEIFWSLLLRYCWLVTQHRCYTMPVSVICLVRWQKILKSPRIRRFCGEEIWSDNLWFSGAMLELYFMLQVTEASLLSRACGFHDFFIQTQHLCSEIHITRTLGASYFTHNLLLFPYVFIFDWI